MDFLVDSGSERNRRMRRKSDGYHVNENETPLAVGVDVAASRLERPETNDHSSV